MLRTLFRGPAPVEEVDHDWDTDRFVDFHRRHPTVPNRFATYLHELPEAALGMKVHVTDYDEFDLSGEVVAINRDANELIIDVEFTSGQAGHSALGARRL